MKKTISIEGARQVPDISENAGNLAFTGAAVSLLLIVALHFLKPEFHPAWRFLSEYANGQFGWLMRLAFFSMALSCGSLFVALRKKIQTVGGKIGLAFLIASFVGLTMASMFSMDLITTPPDQATREGSLHGIASMIGMPSLPIAALLISISLARNPEWTAARKRLLWTTSLMWVSFLSLFVVIGVMLPKAGGFGPDVWIGWPNRALMLGYGLWLMAVARGSCQS